MLTIEYNIREESNTTFYEINNNIHIDHILPQKFYNKIDEWRNITDIENTKLSLNKLGNMALLLGKKNEEALNFGFSRKMNIYSGKDTNKTGKNSFDTTQEIIDNYNKGDLEWDIAHINKRQEYLMEKIESLLNIKENQSIK